MVRQVSSLRLAVCLFPSLLVAGEALARVAPSTARAITPADVVRQVGLSPAAGNGLQPVSAVLDAARGRLFVLNSLSRNLSVVDVRGRRVTAVIPLHMYWDQLNHGVQMAFDPRGQRVLIAATEMTQPHASKVVTVGLLK